MRRFIYILLYTLLPFAAACTISTGAVTTSGEPTATLTATSAIKVDEVQITIASQTLEAATAIPEPSETPTPPNVTPTPREEPEEIVRTPEVKEAPYDISEVPNPFNKYEFYVIDNNVWGKGENQVRKIVEWYYHPDEFKSLIEQAFQLVPEKLSEELAADDFRASPGAKPHLENALRKLQEHEGAPMFCNDVYTGTPYVSPDGEPHAWITAETKIISFMQIDDGTEPFTNIIDLSKFNPNWGDNGKLKLRQQNGEAGKGGVNGFFYDAENDVLINAVKIPPNSTGNDIYENLEEHEVVLSNYLIHPYEHILKSFGFRYWQIGRGSGVIQSTWTPEMNTIMLSTIYDYSKEHNTSRPIGLILEPPRN